MLMTALHFLLEHGLADMAHVPDQKATVSEQMMQAGKATAVLLCLCHPNDWCCTAACTTLWLDSRATEARLQLQRLGVHSVACLWSVCAVWARFVGFQLDVRLEMLMRTVHAMQALLW